MKGTIDLDKIYLVQVDLSTDLSSVYLVRRKVSGSSHQVHYGY